MRTASKLFAALLLCVIGLVKTQVIEHCKTEKAEIGVCVSLDKCFALRDSRNATEASSEQLEIVKREREKCANRGFAPDAVCCRRKPPVIFGFSYVDKQPTTEPLQDLASKVLPNIKDCGKHEADKIFFGNVTDLGQYPWLALIKCIREGEVAFICGGSLINNRYVLTAAHCITSDIHEVRLGEWSLETDPDCIMKDGKKTCAFPVIDAGIEKILLHPNFKRRKSQGGRVDMALIRLNQDVEFTDYVKPICLPTTDAEATLKSAQYVSGWGQTEDLIPSTKKLFAVVNHIEQDQCIKDLLDSPDVKIDDTLICARGKDSRDSCKGDSGGPLMQIVSVPFGKFKLARLFQTGIVSDGLACGTTKPAFYTNVYNQMEWIVSNIAQ